MTVGIYRIYHKDSGKSYIGQSNKIENRVKCHFRALRNGDHYNQLFQNAYNKYGESAFAWQIVEICEVCELTYNEQLWVDNLKYSYGIYNTLEIAGSTRGFTHSQKAKDKISKAHKNKPKSEEHKQKLRESALGRKHTLEAKMRMSASQMGHKVSKETIEKIINTRKEKRALRDPQHSPIC